ncbi:MAG: TonB family protein [Candidatus Krumholzibacteriia bacterium]
MKLRHSIRPGLVLLLALALPVCAQDAASAPASPPEPDVAPELVSFVDADYPPRALREGREGTVMLELLVSEAGVVDSVAVVQGLAPDLDQAAVAAARRFVFTPALVQGEPVPVYVQFAYAFSVREQTRRIADVVNLRGRLREMGTREPLGGAMVVAVFTAPDTAGLAVPFDAYLARLGQFDGQFLEEGNLVTFTDADGWYEFRSLPPGGLELRFPNAGFEPLTEALVLAEGELLTVESWQRRTEYSEYEMVVYGRAEEREVTRQNLSVTEVERLPGFGGDVIKSLQALPGVARPTMEDPGAVVIRGSGNYDTRYFLDGIDIPLLFHYGGVKSTYNSLALQSVDMYPGGFGTAYGNAVGGIVELKGRPGRGDRWHVIADGSLLDATLHAEGPLADDLTLTVSARRSFIGEVLDAALSSQDDLTLAMAPYYADGVLRLDYRHDTDHRFFFTAFGVKDRMSLIVGDAREGSPEVNAATDEIAMDVRYSRFILGYDADFSRRLRNSLRAAYGHSSETGHVFGYFDWEGKGPLWQLRDELTWDAADWAAPHLGGELLRTPYEYRVQALGWEESLEKKTFGLRSGWANVDLDPLPGLKFTPGVRYDYYDHLDDGKLSLRTSARYEYRDGRVFTASWGQYNQHPQPVGQSTDPVYGNPDLPLTTATHATLGHEWRWTDRTSLKIEAYYNTQDDIPAVTDSLGLNFVPDTDARMYGLEFMLRHEPHDGFFGWLSYSVGRAQRRYARSPDPALADFDPSRWYLYGLDQTHHVEAVGSWRIGRGWSFGSRMQYVSGVPMTPLLSFGGRQWEFDADTGEYVPIGGEYFSERMAPYFRCDLRVDKTWVRKTSIWSVYLDLQNANYFVYNSPEGYTYNYDYSKRDEYGWIFMPAVGVRVEY